MIVVKVGGSEGIDLDAVCQDVAALHQSGHSLVLVHGGSHETNVVAEKLGHPPVFVTSVSGYVSRYTDRETLAIFEMVYCGKLNKSIVEKLQQLGVNAIGLSGIDGRLLEGRRKPTLKIVQDGKKRVLRDDYTGKVERANVGLIQLLLENGYVPVVTPPAISEESEAINVDGDRAAAVLASALHAEQLIILSNVPGLLRDFPNEDSLIPLIDKDRVEDFMEFAEGRMKKKVMGAAEAVSEGVGQVVFADARVARPVPNAMAGRGTVIK
jgi:acetylglutamate/LysW-gamma-L-alpha-aminoadipate kinase